MEKNGKWKVKMKRFIVVGLMLGILSGCATFGVVSKPPVAVTVEEKTDLVWEWWEWLNFISGLSFLKGW